MTTAREIMTADPAYVRSSDTVHEAAQMMTDLGVGALPIYGEDNKLRGMITDRDIVVKVIGQQHDARAVHVGELAQDKVVTVGPDDDVEKVLTVMTAHQVRRVPVVDGDELVGIVALADVARSLKSPKVGELVEALSVD